MAIITYSAAAGWQLIALVACGAPFAVVVAGLAALAACGWLAVGA